ncbi:hypothetical protein GOP47_0013130 [Adiantum capillus-veneris]|uniref:Uncharacterized protein n=1 Tax=Adiantum capillus-veneris TaxID=13818 RepID=A0A9D4UMZ0_ADICA|nr:hypothetical protein GOP47_0013130 [Adiantum capillus-veneris]
MKVLAQWSLWRARPRSGVSRGRRPGSSSHGVALCPCHPPLFLARRLAASLTSFRRFNGSFECLGVLPGQLRRFFLAEAWPALKPVGVELRHYSFLASLGVWPNSDVEQICNSSICLSRRKMAPIKLESWAIRR